MSPHPSCPPAREQQCATRSSRPRTPWPPHFLTVNEVAARLNVCRSTVYNLIASGRIPPTASAAGRSAPRPPNLRRRPRRLHQHHPVRVSV
ncbi:helix-turn-helix domain-containing protein [Streptomyces sp. M10(2022)]